MTISRIDRNKPLKKIINIAKEYATYISTSRITRRIIMPKEKGDLEQLIAQLQQQRDELMLQLHLGKAEARDELEKLEKKWEQLVK